jgi:DNA-binding transcriptional ArsR family regulator
MDLSLSENDLSQAALILKAISNEKRLLILCALRDGEKNVGELEKVVNLSQSALSQHLARLRRDSIVTTRREAQVIYYSLSCPRTSELLDKVFELLSDSD